MSTDLDGCYHAPDKNRSELLEVRRLQRELTAARARRRARDRRRRSRGALKDGKMLRFNGSQLRDEWAQELLLIFDEHEVLTGML